MWNYRIFKGDNNTYGLYEAIYNDAGEIAAHDQNAILIGESVDDLIQTVEMMRKDIDRCKNDIPHLDEIEFAPLYDENEPMEEIDPQEFFDNLDKDPGM